MSAARVLLCDADGNLFPSEGPAFDASTTVTNRFLEAIGSERRFEPAELRGWAEGRNFRATATALADAAGVALDDAELERWVDRERREVAAHLARVLRPDPSVTGPCRRLAERVRLAVVSSSATARLDACFRATGLDELFPPAVRISAEDSLPEPASKPDPAVYAFAGERFGVGPADAIAVEDSVAGTLSAVGAGFPVVGNVQFVEEAERPARTTALLAAGAARVVASWSDVEAAV